MKMPEIDQLAGTSCIEHMEPQIAVRVTAVDVHVHHVDVLKCAYFASAASVALL